MLPFTRDTVYALKTGIDADCFAAEHLDGYVWVNGYDDGAYSLLCTPEYAASWCRRFSSCVLAGNVGRMGARIPCNVPPYSACGQAVRRLEAEIEGRGLQQRYCEELERLLEPQEKATDGPYLQHWRNVTASPLLRVKAALLSILER